MALFADHAVLPSGDGARGALDDAYESRNDEDDQNPS
jgi:hypothetical protein